MLIKKMFLLKVFSRDELEELFSLLRWLYEEGAKDVTDVQEITLKEVYQKNRLLKKRQTGRCGGGWCSGGWCGGGWCGGGWCGSGWCGGGWCGLVDLIFSFIGQISQAFKLNIWKKLTILILKFGVDF